MFSRSVDWDADAQTIRQLVRSCIREAAAATASSVAAANSHPEHEMLETDESGAGSSAGTDQRLHDVLAFAAGSAGSDSQMDSSVADSGRERSHNGSIRDARPLEEVTAPDGGSAGGEALGNAAWVLGQHQSAEGAKARSATSRQLLQALRPLAQRLLLDAHRATHVDAEPDEALLA